MELAKAGNLVEIGIALTPQVLEDLFFTARDSKTVHRNKQSTLLLVGDWGASGGQQPSELAAPHKSILACKTRQLW